MRTNWSADFQIGALRKQRGGFRPVRLRLALALLLAGGCFAAAQSNRVPGPTDYQQFAQFITQRNIFDPRRYAVPSGVYHPPTPPVVRYTPQFTLVGTMSYEKGLFAFFDGNQSNLRKVLYPTDTNGIAGFAVTNITLGGVILQSADKKQTVPMKIGQGMQQVGGNWQLIAQGGSFGGGGSYNGGGGGRTRGFGGGGFGGYSGGGGESMAPATENSSPDTSAASGSDLSGNDVLKRLMQQRQQELK